MQAVRQWSVRHASALKRVYDACAQWAPHLRRLLQWAGARRAERLLLPVERATKHLLFDCKMCGQCALSSTGMACPTNCAKQMRNGPCGGVRADGGCEVDGTMRCVWVEATNGQKRIDPPQIKTFLGPIDHRLWNRSSWPRVIDGTHALPTVIQLRAAPAREIFSFEQACKSGRFIVTVEVSPPDSADPGALIARASRFGDLVDAINITDDAGAQFIQTLFCFDVPMLADFMGEVRARELHKRCAIIVGVGTLSNAKSLRRMVQHVPGVYIPESVLQRIVGADNQKAEARTVLVETIRAASEIEGVAGVHLMGYRNDDVLAEAIAESGIRRGVSTRAA